MVAIALLLGLLGLELIRGLDASRLARRAGLVAAATFLALTCWNHEAWIARQNVGGSGTGRLDTSYLVWHLSPNAVPALVDALAGLPAGPRHDLWTGLQERYGRRSEVRRCQWFEWNLRHAEAARALARAGLVSEPVGAGTCARIEGRRGVSG